MSYCGQKMPGHQTATCVKQKGHSLTSVHRSLQYEWYPFIFGSTAAGRKLHLILRADWHRVREPGEQRRTDRQFLCGQKTDGGVTGEDYPKDGWWVGMTFKGICARCQRRFDSYHLEGIHDS